MGEYLLAFDLGTTGNKAALVEAATGRVAAGAFAGYRTYYTENGGAEQSPEDWWRSTVQCCKELAHNSPREFAQVAAIGATGMMNGLVLVDREGASLAPAMIHADVRGTAECRELKEQFGAGSIFDETANRPDPHLTLPKAMWLARKQPDLIAKAAHVVQAKDYLVSRLTACVGVTDPSDASLTGGFDVRRRVWLSELWDIAGIPSHLLPTVVPSTQVVGRILPEVARETGLKNGTPVVMGGGDGACATAGSGVPTGQAYNYLGGTSWIGLVLNEPLYDDRLSSYCALDERVTTFGTVQAAGSSVEWIGQILGVPENGFSEMDDAAQQIEPGARNLFFLPYLQGERAPIWDADAKGVFFGLTSAHTPTHLFRAVIEGVAFALRSILDVFTENGYGGNAIPSVRLLGGGAQSKLWRTILSAVFERSLVPVADCSSATSLGAAMAAGVGVGLYPSIAEAARLVQVVKREESDTSLAMAYTPRYAFYQTLYPALSERFHELARASTSWPDYHSKLRDSAQENAA